MATKAILSCETYLSIILSYLALTNLAWPFTGQTNLRFGQPSYANYQETLMVLSSYAIPLTPVKKGLKELTVTPAFVEAHEKDQSAPKYLESEGRGFGGIVSWFHALKDSWGYSVNFSYMVLKGKLLAMTEYDTTGNLLRKHMAAETGHTVQLMGYFVYDYFYDNEKIGLPLFIGLGLYECFQKATLRAAVNVPSLPANTMISYKAQVDSVSAGIILGGSFQFNTGDFRWAPFVAFFLPLEPAQYSVNGTREDTGELLSTLNQTLSSKDKILSSGGLGIGYLPLGINFKWVPNIFNLFYYLDKDEDIGQTIITISKTWKF